MMWRAVTEEVPEGNIDGTLGFAARVLGCPQGKAGVDLRRGPFAVIAAIYVSEVVRCVVRAVLAVG